MLNESASSIFWRLVRIYVGYRVVRLYKAKLRAVHLEGSGTVLALLLGALTAKLLSRAFDWVLCKLLDMDRLGPIDRLFLYDSDRRPAIGVSVFFTTKFTNEEYVREYASRYKRSWPRAQSKLIKIFGKDYFIKMKEEEFKAKEKDVFKFVEGVHTEKALLDYAKQ